MSLKNAFIAELKHESALTKKMLERVPFDKQDWKPHEKSMALGKLAEHVAEIPHWVSDIINIDEFDFTKDYKPSKASSKEELLKDWEEKPQRLLQTLKRCPMRNLIKCGW